MLKLRLLTAAILIPLFVLFLMKSTSYAFALFTALAVLLGAWEWSALMGLKTLLARISYVFITFLLLKYVSGLYVPTVLTIAGIWWVVAFLLILAYPWGYFWQHGLGWRALMGFLVLLPCWVALNFIRIKADFGIYLLLFLCVLIWGADSGAYFAGKKWGKNKLAPLVSPGKTREGLWGALIVGIVISSSVSLYNHASLQAFLLTNILGTLVVLFSVVGDLFESMFKRFVGIKDSGTLFPGHGGLLDRIDSLTAAAPIFALGILIFF